MSDLVKRLRARVTGKGLPEAWEECNCADDACEAADEIERLQAIVARLPKDAEGNPVIVGEPAKFWVVNKWRVSKGILVRRKTAKIMVQSPKVGKFKYFKLSEGYPTRELAEAAMQEQTEPEDE